MSEMELATIATAMKRIPRLALLGLGFVVMLAVTFAMVPPESAQSDVVAPVIAAAVLMLVFGPYLLAVGCTTGFLPDFGSFWGVAAMVPLCALHIAFLSVLSTRTSLWRRMGRFGERARRFAVFVLAFVSVAGVWYEMPCVTRYDISVDGDKVPAEGLRFALVTDLHSCRYGAGQRVISEKILALNPDAILLSGDIFDDRLPDGNAKAFLAAVTRERPCFYAFGNHEHWSERVPEMRGILESAGVTVLEGTVRTTVIKGVEIDFCGIDDPTYMADEEWLGQLASVAAAANPSRLRVLLSHRPEYSGSYADYDFDLICSGHLHGGHFTAGSGESRALDSASAVRRQEVRLPAKGFCSRGAQEAPIASTTRRPWSSPAASLANRRRCLVSSTIQSLSSSTSSRGDAAQLAADLV